jgi:hypothetical protein
MKKSTKYIGHWWKASRQSSAQRFVERLEEVFQRMPLLTPKA